MRIQSHRVDVLLLDRYEVVHWSVGKRHLLWWADTEIFEISNVRNQIELKWLSKVSRQWHSEAENIRKRQLHLLLDSWNHGRFCVTNNEKPRPLEAERLIYHHTLSTCLGSSPVGNRDLWVMHSIQHRNESVTVILHKDNDHDCV